MISRTAIISGFIVAVVAVASVTGAYVVNPHWFTPSTVANSNTKLQVVAGENFWGSLVSQLGGTHVQVQSIVTDPNADPHEYESNIATARAFATANYVIINGAGYDTWAERIISSSDSHNQKVMNVANLLGKKEGDNPHFWYSPTFVNITVHAMYNDLVSIDSNDASYFKQQYANLNVSLGQYNARIDEIRTKFSGTPVASTESIFEYLADATGLRLLSPPGFMKAVAEGNDPSPQDIATFQKLLQNKNVTVLVYNAQTVTPLTEQIRALAAQNNIPTVAVTETVQPPDVSFQDWMNAELIALQNALNAQALGQ